MRSLQAVQSCVMPVSAVGQDEVTTLEGLGTPDKPQSLQMGFLILSAIASVRAYFCGKLLILIWLPPGIRTPIC